MFAAACPSDAEDVSARSVERLARVRAHGRLAVAFETRGTATVAARTFETGGYRVRMPRVERCEAVLLNTGGGLAGGDRLDIEVAVEAGASAWVTTQAAERIYRSLGPSARIDACLALADGARLAWLPQETILYSGARLERTIKADLSGNAMLTLAEIVVYGRRAMGETLGTGLLRDRWRLNRDGRLILAEDVRLDGALDALLARPTVAGGAHVTGTLVHAAADAEDRLERVRAALADARANVAASAWPGVLCVRAIGRSSEAVRADIAAAATLLTGGPLPRSWST